LIKKGKRKEIKSFFIIKKGNEVKKEYFFFIFEKEYFHFYLSIKLYYTEMFDNSFEKRKKGFSFFLKGHSAFKKDFFFLKKLFFKISFSPIPFYFIWKINWQEGSDRFFSIVSIIFFFNKIKEIRSFLFYIFNSIRTLFPPQVSLFNRL